MNKKRKIIYSILATVVAIGFIIYANVDTFKEIKKEVVVDTPRDKGTNPTKPEESVDNPFNEEIPEINESDAYVDGEEKAKYFMDGSREKAEVKPEDFTSLLTQEPKEFQPVLPVEWTKVKLQADSIKDFETKEPEERMKEFKNNTSLTADQVNEFEKIKKVEFDMYAAFNSNDYNTYLKNMYKQWREYYGVAVGNIIKDGEFQEQSVAFVPEIVDLKIGYAYVYYAKKTSFVEKGTEITSRTVDGYKMFKQNHAGEWELYYEISLLAD